ncbi:hypothetical protein ACSSUR_23530 [Pseudomonas cedrina]|uniref:hypothetical protein n=1 Tax=Pseudomonas cedrina TaxID=651740 RepID=UPI003ED9897C
MSANKNVRMGRAYSQYFAEASRRLLALFARAMASEMRDRAQERQHHVLSAALPSQTIMTRANILARREAIIDDL